MNQHKIPLSVIIITLNEERNIVDCIKSVAWANDIVVVDSRSTDNTVSLARQYTSNIHIVDWIGYAGTKDFALTKTANEWVFWLDADERVTEDLATEIQQIVALPAITAAGYEVARRAFFLGKWIKHCGWYPGYVVRLFTKSHARFNDSRVHERLDVQGNIGRLHNDLLHFTDDTLFHYFVKFNRYTTLAAQDLIHKGKSCSLFDILVRPPYLFLKMYILRVGFLDGMHGLILSLVSAAYVFCKYAKCWDLERMKPKEG